MSELPRSQRIGTLGLLGTLIRRQLADGFRHHLASKESRNLRLVEIPQRRLDHVLAPLGGIMPMEWNTEWELLEPAKCQSSSAG
jgi:hypothetical protein